MSETCFIESNHRWRYAEGMITEARGISAVLDDLKSAEAAPLLCAGITTYNALRNAGVRGEDLVAVQGVGDC